MPERAESSCVARNVDFFLKPRTKKPASVVSGDGPGHVRFRLNGSQHVELDAAIL